MLTVWLSLRCLLKIGLNMPNLLHVECLTTAVCVESGVDPIQMPHSVASDLGLNYFSGLFVCILIICNMNT